MWVNPERRGKGNATQFLPRLSRFFRGLARLWPGVEFHFLLSRCTYLLITVWYCCGRVVRSNVLEYLWRMVLSCECKSRSACSPIERRALTFLYSRLSNSVLFISTFSASATKRIREVSYVQSIFVFFYTNNASSKIKNPAISKTKLNEMDLH